MAMRRCRGLALVLAAVLLLVCVQPVVGRASVPDYPNTHINTGDQRADVLAVALTQMGYTEGTNNATKYGSWAGYPHQPWCATFVSWCMRQAEIGPDVIQKCPVASPNRFGIPYYDGDEYTPSPGDLFFTKEFSHVGFVYYVDGAYFYTVEGNVNIDENEDGYFVMTLKRKISDFYFGVPAYKGSGEHSYVRVQETEHPHSISYRCEICGDQYDTGIDAVESGCGTCMECGCDSKYAGYYVTSQNGTFYIRDGHSTKGQIIGCASNNAVVYVYGINHYTGRAYIDYDGVRGHYPADYLKKYYPAPAQPVLSVADKTYIGGDDVVLKWNQSTHAEEFRLQISRDGDLITDEPVGKSLSYTLKNAQPGNYTFSVFAANRTGWSAPAEQTLWVRERCSVSFDANGGSEAPETVVILAGDLVTLPNQIPKREGYVFLGWTAEQGSNLAVYPAGAQLLCDGDLVLYAVWREENAVAQSLRIETMPLKQVFCVGDPLDTAGLVLEITYTDGSGRLTADGFTVEGFSSEQTGMNTLNVICEGLTVSYDVEVVTHLPGDINLDNAVNRDDVMELLWHINFPQQFPIVVSADFTGDGKINRDDVMHLLWHITFPEMFPL